MARAATLCHVGQPTLSIQIKKLEEYLGLSLFERTGKSLRVTEAAKPIIAIARGIVAESNRLRDTARQLSDPFALPFRLGVFPTLAPYMLPRVMPAVNRAFPKLTLRLVEEKSPVLTERLLSGELDAILSSLPMDGADLQSAHLFDDPFLLACATTHALAKRKFVTRADLKNASLMLLDDGHCLRDQALDVCAVTHAREDGEFRATSLETLRHMVASGAGITLIPKIAATPTTGLVYIPFRRAEAPLRRIGLVWRRSAPQKKLMGDLATVLQRHVTA